MIYHHQYHIVWTPKYRYQILDGALKAFVDESVRSLCEWKSCEVIELTMQKDHVHLIVTIPPKVSVSTLMGILKGKTAIKIFKSYPELKKKPYWGNHFWARGYCSSTIGFDEDKVRKYVKYQGEQEKKAEQQALDFGLF